MVTVLSVRAIVLVVSPPKVAIRALVVEAVSSNFPVHVGDLASAVLERVVLRPNTEAHFAHEENHVSLRHQLAKNVKDNNPGIRVGKRRRGRINHKSNELEALSDPEKQE